MELEKAILIQYADLQEEIKDIRHRIERIKKQIDRIESSGTVIDAVKGTRKDGTFGSIRIEGFPCPSYDKKLTRLKIYLTQLNDAKNELLELTSGVEEYINTIEDSHIRRIVRYRVIDGMTWRKIAFNMGGSNTEDSVRMAFNRFIGKN